MNAEVSRIKQDLKIVEQAIGRGPEYQYAHVWAGIGWGIAGIAMVVGSLLPSIPYAWTTVLFLALFVALPPLLSTWMSGKCVLVPYDNLKVSGLALSAIATAIITPMLLLWFARIGMTSTQMRAVGFLTIGLILLAYAWGRPARRSLAVSSLGLIVLGIATPFLPFELTAPAVGAAIAFVGFAGAAVLHFQLRADCCDEQAAH